MGYSKHELCVAIFRVPTVLVLGMGAFYTQVCFLGDSKYSQVNKEDHPSQSRWTTPRTQWLASPASQWSSSSSPSAQPGATLRFLF